jgi:hypothetical protein
MIDANRYVYHCFLAFSWFFYQNFSQWVSKSQNNVKRLLISRGFFNRYLLDFKDQKDDR